MADALKQREDDEVFDYIFHSKMTLSDRSLSMPKPSSMLMLTLALTSVISPAEARRFSSLFLGISSF